MPNDLAARYLTLHEFVLDARERLDANGWDYLIGGTETETGVRRNRHAIESVALRPRVLNDVSLIDASTRIFGHDVRLPVMLAPVGGLETFDEGAALTVAEAAGQFGLPLMLSSVSKTPMEAVREKTGNVAIYQLYVRDNDEWVDAQVERAIAAGFDAFCLTVDSAVYSRRERDIVKRFRKPWRAHVDDRAVHYQAALNWNTVARIKRNHDVPLMLKGIATAEDAKIAVEHGVDAIYVSNHGGRQLDHGRGSLDVLPEIVDAAGGKVPVFIDGGFCRGTDILKAIAMGADAVGIGRLYCYAMAAAGAPGIVRMLEILEIEITSALGLLGAPSLDALSDAHISPGSSVVSDLSVLGAFPLIDPDGVR
jgi:glycolate oxidase